MAARAIDIVMENHAARSNEALQCHVLKGRGESLGERHGALLRRQINEFVEDDLQRLNKLSYERMSIDTLLPLLREYGQSIESQLPELGAEIRGLALGARISYEQALLLQLRREVLGYSPLTIRGDCTTFARVSEAECVLAQTVDLAGGLESEAYVIRIENAGRDQRTLILLTFTGLLGYLGINSHGLAIGLNLVMGGRWRPGVPGYLAIRHLLETATCVDQCIDELTKLDLASSRSLMLCDTRKSMNVELLENELRSESGRQLVHANHFHAPTFRERDQINVFARNGSRARSSACVKALAALPNAADLEDYFSVLQHPDICVEPDGNLRREATVARVVMKPRERTLAVKRGCSREARAQVFRLEAQ